MPSKGMPQAEIQTTGRAGLSASHGAGVVEGSKKVLKKKAILEPGTDTDGSTTEDTQIVFANPATTAVTITLSTADAKKGRVITVVDVSGNAGTNNITINTEGTANINGGTLTISSNYGSFKVICNGTNWFTI